MPSRPARTGRSSSRSSRRREGAPQPPPGAGSGGADAEPTVAVGEVVGVHGLRGLLRVRPYPPPAPSIAAGRELLLEQGGVARRVRLSGATAHGGVLLVGIDGVHDRTAAEALRGARVLVPLAELPPAGPDEFYWHEMIGYVVETVAGERLGTIAGTMDTGLNDVWIVRDGDREHLLPVIADVVRAIDRQGRRVVVDPLPGLLD